MARKYIKNTDRVYNEEVTKSTVSDASEYEICIITHFLMRNVFKSNIEIKE